MDRSDTVVNGGSVLPRGMPGVVVGYVDALGPTADLWWRVFLLQIWGARRSQESGGVVLEVRGSFPGVHGVLRNSHVLSERDPPRASYIFGVYPVYVGSLKRNNILLRLGGICFDSETNVVFSEAMPTE